MVRRPRVPCKGQNVDDGREEEDKRQRQGSPQHPSSTEPVPEPVECEQKTLRADAEFRKKDNRIAELKAEVESLRAAAAESSAASLTQEEDLTLEDFQTSVQSVLDVVECGFCLETVRPDMVQCLSGHVVCTQCKDTMNVTKCPTCQQTFSTVKPRALAQVLKLLPRQCRFKNCQVFVKPGDDHEKFCAWKMTQCMLFSCEFSGTGKELVDHVNKDHPIRLIVSSSKTSRLSNFNQNSGFYLQLYSVHGQVFWLKAHIKGNSLNVTLHFTPNGKPKEVLFYKIEFKSEKSEFISKIKLNLDPEVDTSVENRFTIPGFMLSDFMEGNSLVFTGTITKENNN